MSNATPPTLQTPASTTTADPLHALVGSCFTGVRAAAFWVAVLLPFATILLVSSGVVAGASTMLGLVGANVACAVVGHNYSR